MDDAKKLPGPGQYNSAYSSLKLTGKTITKNVGMENKKPSTPGPNAYHIEKADRLIRTE